LPVSISTVNIKGFVKQFISIADTLGDQIQPETTIGLEFFLTANDSEEFEAWQAGRL